MPDLSVADVPGKKPLAPTKAAPFDLLVDQRAEEKKKRLAEKVNKLIRQINKFCRTKTKCVAGF